MIVATLNRTLKAFALAKVGAEYVLRWLPAGTHDWNEVPQARGDARLPGGDGRSRSHGPFGVVYDPLTAAGASATTATSTT